MLWFWNVLYSRLQLAHHHNAIIQAMPRFNGEVYYLERGRICEKVYETARELERRYDDIGFVRLRGHPNDEVLVSLAMALHGQEPIPERGDIMNCSRDREDWNWTSSACTSCSAIPRDIPSIILGTSLRR